jgi:hypothetical protein
MQTSTRRGIPYPDLTRGDRPDVPAHIYNLVQRLDVDVVYQQGTDADRGASGHFIQGGRFWWTTDTNRLWYDDGNTWWLATGDISGAIPFTIIDAKGDLIAGAADNQAVRFPVGQNGQILMADNSQSTGLVWTDRVMTYITQPASYASADPPTFVMNIIGVNLTTQLGFGTRVFVLQGGVNKWFIVTGTSYAGGNTQITMYGGTDYVLANAAITQVGFSNAKSPPGFNPDVGKWSVLVYDATNKIVTNPAQKVWVNPGVSITIPIGSWTVGYSCFLKSRYTGGAGEITDFVTLSTTTSTETDHAWTSAIYSGNNDNSATRMGATLFKTRPVFTAAKVTYNMLAYPNDPNCSEIGFYGADGGSTVIHAVCGYL